MDKKLSVHHKRSPKQSKPKKKPIKIVYISNPMRVETSASEFRARVQELTGWESDYSKFNPTDAADDALRGPTDRSTGAVDDDPIQVGPLPGVDPSGGSSSRSTNSSDDWFDDVFTPQMMENFPGLLVSNPLMLM